ncbi:17049_t:CDS:2 [Funneliformis geosporum]|uniref:12157_t:CDS:1 n=1 Tax=Funneliformis geosporum TaxID=1117311 RepID=A0A9W4WHK8_9GLOM|nr:17049_t:CDS:2 [Funneliformis geosporum]CAI2162381.1 12157_t:CDS:2 [Funneliformis geosporum]
MVKPTQPFDDDFRFLTDAVILIGHQLFNVKKDECLTQILKNLGFNELPFPTAELVSAQDSNIVTLSIGKLNNIIKKLAQNVGELSEQLMDQLMTLLRMGVRWKFKLSNEQVVHIFGLAKDCMPSEKWLQSAVQQINTLVYYTLRNLMTPHTLAIALLLFLLSWSVYDLCKIYNECKIMDDKTEGEKQDYLKSLNDIDEVLTKICDYLDNRRIDRFDELLQTLIKKSKNLINKIQTSKVQIEERIKLLKEKESNRKTIRNILGVTSGFFFGITFYNWSDLNAIYRTLGITGSATTAGGAIALHISIDKLNQTLDKQKNVLNNMNDLNNILTDIILEVKFLKYESIDHEVLRIQFRGYKNSLQELQTRFR